MQQTNIIDLGKVGITVEKTPWSASTFYERLTMVHHKESGNTYVSVEDNVNRDPSKDDGSNWILASMNGMSIYELMVARGKYSGTEEQFLADYNKAVSDAKAAAATATTATTAALAAADEANKAKVQAAAATELCENATEKAIEVTNEAKNAAEDAASIKEALDNFIAQGGGATDAQVVKNTGDISQLSLKTEEIEKEKTDDRDTESVEFTDDYGNIIHHIDENEADFKNLKSSGKKVMTIDDIPTESTNVEKTNEEISFETDEGKEITHVEFETVEDEEEAVEFELEDGRKPLVINKNGVRVFGRDIVSGSSLAGKTMWSLGDSLSENVYGNKGWQPKFVELTGCTWYPELNIKSGSPLSTGGTETMPYVANNGQERALNLAKYKGVYPIDLIIYENVNDNHWLPYQVGPGYIGDISDKPFMFSQNLEYSLSEPFLTNGVAREYFNNNFSTIVSSFTSSQRKKGTILSMPVKSYGSKVQFSGSVARNGNVVITWAGKQYSVAVTTSMSINQVVDAFVSWAFEGGEDKNIGSGVLQILATSNSSDRVTAVDTGNTGLSASVTDTTGVGTYNCVFNGDNAAEFIVRDKWSVGRTLTLYAIYKGLIEYLQRTFPEATIMWLMPYSISYVNNSTLKNDDGSWSQDKFNNYNGYKNRKELFEIQRNVCEYYSIPYFDVFKKSGIGINNVETYFNENNVHPKSIGYDRWAECMAKEV